MVRSVQRLLVAVVLSTVVLGACSSSSHSSGAASGGSAFCAVARQVKAENARPGPRLSPAEQRKTLVEQFERLKVAASPPQGGGWVEAVLPPSHAAVAHLDRVLRRDCGLTVNILGRSVSSTKATAATKP